MIRRHLLALALIAAPCALAAQAGTAPLVLRLPAGPRAMALGDAYVTGSGAEELFYNPARLSSGSGSMISLGAWGSNGKMGTLGTTMSVAGNFTAGFGARYLDYQAPSSGLGEPGDLTAPGSVQATQLAATFALQHNILGFQMGGAVTYVADHSNGGRNGAATWTVGLTQGIGNFTFGLVAQDFGQQLVVGNALRDIPERLTLGATSQSFSVGDYIDITPVAAVSVDRAHDVRPGGGLNFAYTPVQGFEFAARVGVRWVDSTTVQQPSPFTFGLGFTLDRLSIDYAFEPYSGGNGAAHRIGIRAR